MVKPRLVLIAALLLISSAAVAQTSDTSGETPETELGEGVLAHNFVMRGLPASNGEEVDVERSFEVETDEDESFSISQEEAIETALNELGSSEWDLDEAERSEGLYELEFVRGESEAEVYVDGSTGRIVEFEAEIEYEPLDESSAVLSGFIQFSSDRFEVDTDIDVNEDSNEAYVEIEIEESSDAGSDVVTRRSIREFEDAEPGEYTGILEVIRDDEVVHSERQRFQVPGPVEGEETESGDSEEDSEGLEEMSREELVNEVRDLRAQVERLRQQVSEGVDRPQPDTPAEPDEDVADRDSTEENEQEADESVDSEETEEADVDQTPGNSENRPGFVNRMLSGLFR